MASTEEPSSLRRRGISDAEPIEDAEGAGPSVSEPQVEDELNVPEPQMQEKTHQKDASAQGTGERKLDLESDTYWLTRIVIIRYLAFVYCVAFLVALNQNAALLGENGLLPVTNYMRRISNIANNSLTEMLEKAPTILWFVDYEKNVDKYLDMLAYVGLALSSVVFLTGRANAILMFLLWHCDFYMNCLTSTGLVISSFTLLTGRANMISMLVLWVIYHSIANLGQTWYSFGWESQILETGFLAIFLCPLFTTRSMPRSTPPSYVVIWAYRWLIFRIMIGAGLIKIRGDRCWRDLTCMNYHYETQPVPNPVAYFAHQSPEMMHKFEVLSNHFIELVAPFLLMPLLPRRCRLIGGFIQVFFQVVLIISGNLSFLNWLTIVPAIACFDDRSLSWLFSARPGWSKWQVWDMQQADMQGKRPQLSLGNRVRRVLNISLGLLIAYLSLPIVQNLLSRRQIMNTSFDPLRLVNTYGSNIRVIFDVSLAMVLGVLSVPVVLNLLSPTQVMNTSFESLRIVNTYGAFGSITKERTEVIFQGTYDNPNITDAKWLEYEFICKPGNVKRRPCIISPYHYRLDWLMWFAAFGQYEHHPWLLHLAGKLLYNDPVADSLIETNPFHGSDPPKWVRAEHFRYTFTKIGSREAKQGKWWKRKRIGNYLPPLSLSDIKDYMKAMRWKVTPKRPRKKRFH